MYHDIGKSIIIERHPEVGWHLVRDVKGLVGSTADNLVKDLYPLILGEDPVQWNLELHKANNNWRQITDRRQQQLLHVFEVIIRYHDYFGVLSTGEASYPIMIDLIGLRRMGKSDVIDMFSVLMLFTLADIYGSVPAVTPTKVAILCDDWRILCDVIARENVDGDRSAFFQELCALSQGAETTIERLHRLMSEGCPPAWEPAIDRVMTEDAFREATYARMNQFLQHFALFCKLDYCLAFKRLLMNEAKSRGRSPATAISVLVSLLAELEMQYGSLTRRPDGSWRRVGLELAGLTRKPGTHKDKKMRTKTRIGETIADLLLEPDGLGGKQWAVSECTAWFLDE